jgi:peptide-methionine (S)-S-oxide reductase
VGYTGGAKPRPTYRELGDHTEAFQVEYDPTRTSYGALLEVFWEDHHPTRPAFGRQYRSAIFVADDEQRRLAETTKRRAEAATGLRLYVDVEPLTTFYRAEDYHQKYGLRRSRELLQELAGYDDRALADSTVAMRLNAYAYGYGTAEELAAELPSLGLSPAGARWLERLLRGKDGASAACGA